MSNETYERGLAVRKDVVGVDYVNRSIAEADDFTRPLQELVTTYCWGAVWTREGLSRKTRSLLNVVMLTVLNRPHAFKMDAWGARCRPHGPPSGLRAGGGGRPVRAVRCCAAWRM